MLICDFDFIFRSLFKMYIMYVFICDTFMFDMSYYVFIHEFVDLPLFIVVKALPSLCCVMFHTYDVK